jgi:membrane-associated phospholipid phosphatase
MLVAFVAIAIGVFLWPANAIDRALSLAVQRATFLDPVFRAASWFGDWPFDVCGPLVAIAALLWIGWRREAVWLGVAVLGAFLIYHGIRVNEPRPRPGLPVQVLEHVTGSSFPSGHVTNYAAFYGCMLLIVRLRVTARWLRTPATVFLVAILALVGPSRVYLGAHWTSDVVAGYLLGGWWVGVSWLLVLHGRGEEGEPRRGRLGIRRVRGGHPRDAAFHGRRVVASSR